MTKAQQTAAKYFGFTKASWNGTFEEEDFKKVSETNAAFQFRSNRLPWIR